MDITAHNLSISADYSAMHMKHIESWTQVLAAQGSPREITETNRAIFVQNVTEKGKKMQTCPHVHRVILGSLKFFEIEM